MQKFPVKNFLLYFLSLFKKCAGNLYTYILLKVKFLLPCISDTSNRIYWQIDTCLEIFAENITYISIIT